MQMQRDSTPILPPFDPALQGNATCVHQEISKHLLLLCLPSAHNPKFKKSSILPSGDHPPERDESDHSTLKKQTLIKMRSRSNLPLSPWQGKYFETFASRQSFPICNPFAEPDPNIETPNPRYCCTGLMWLSSDAFQPHAHFPNSVPDP